MFERDAEESSGKRKRKNWLQIFDTFIYQLLQLKEVNFIHMETGTVQDFIFFANVK